MRGNMRGIGAARRRTTSATTVTGGGAGAVTPAMTVEYVDTSGNRQLTSVAADGTTSISGVAPFLVHFDASGSRSTDPACDDALGAWWYMGYRLNYGEDIGGTWTYGGSRSKDEDTGPPVFGRVFTEVGTHTVRLRCKDSLNNEATISFNVVVSAPPSATNIPVSNGAWPTWANNTHYTLDAGGDYSSFGTINTAGRHNILISKTGAGADPIVATFSPDDTGLAGLGSSGYVRAKNIRLLNIDCATFYFARPGFDYCGIVNGRCRKFGYVPYGFIYDNDLTTVAQRENVQCPRGVFLWNSGVLEEDQDSSGYLMITQVRKLHMTGVTLHYSAGENFHYIRNVMESSTWRYCLMYSSTAANTIFKGQGKGVSGVTSPDAWLADHDRIGLTDGSRQYAYPYSKIVFESCQVGQSGSTNVNVATGWTPQNNDAAPVEGVEYCALEDVLGFGTDPTNFNDEDAGGRYMSVRNFRFDLGTGAYATHRTSVNPNRIPSGWDGPYLYETTNTRPVPTSF